MDIRHITEHPPYILDGTGLTQLFSLQHELVEQYIKVENLPPYPINLSIRKDQYLIKDFVGRVIEELAEAYESYQLMLELYNEPPEGQVVGLDSYLPHLQNFNEELADALHFFLELFIYVDLTESDIKAYLDKRLVALNLQDAFGYGGMDPLESLVQLSRHTNSYAGLKIREYSLAHKVIPDAQATDLFLKGGRSIGAGQAEVIAELSWGVTYHLSIARNFLKNKPWKKSEMLTDKKRFYTSLLEAWLIFFRLLEFVGLESNSIFYIYFKKNRVNQFRIKSNY